MNDELTFEWAARFQSKVLDLGLESGCLVWLGGVDDNGYGNFTATSELRLKAHRAAWLLVKGELPPKTMVLDHLCRNRWCVNVTHLEAVTMSENYWRGASPTAARPDQTLCKKGLHPWVESNLVKTSSGVTCRECKLVAQRAAYRRRKQQR